MLASMCDGPQQPVKLRRLNSGEAVVSDLGEAGGQEQLVEAAHTGLFSLLAGLGMEPVLTPRLEFVCHVLEQAGANALTKFQEKNRNLMTSLDLLNVFFSIKFFAYLLSITSSQNIYPCSQAALLGSRELSRQVLAPVPASLIMQVVRVRPDRFTMETVLRMFDSTSHSGRKSTARLMCLMRNVQADRRPGDTDR